MGAGCKKTRRPGRHKTVESRADSRRVRAVWRRWQDRAVAQRRAGERASGCGRRLEAVAA